MSMAFFWRRMFLVEKVVLGLATVNDGADDVFDKAFGLIHQVVQGNEILLKFNVKKLGKMLVGIGLFSSE